MKTLLFILASALAFGQTALINGSSAKFRNVTGTAAPSSGTCDASSEVGSFYVRTGNQASVPTQVYVCKQTGSSTYAWGPFFGYTQTAAPATCATGELWFDTDATAGSNLNLCTASNTWTAISGAGSSDPASLNCGVTRTSSTILTVFTSASSTTPCVVTIGNKPYSFTSPATATISAGSITAYIYVDSAGTATIASASGTIVGSGLTVVTASAFPVSAYQLWTWTSTSGTWDTSGGTQVRSFMTAAPKFTAGANITLTQTADELTIAAASSGGGTMFSTAGTGSWWPLGAPGYATNSAPIAAPNNVYYFEVVAPGAMTWRNIVGEEGTGDSGKHYAWAVYDSSCNLVQQTSTRTSTAFTAYELALAASISATTGVYYIAYTSDSSTLQQTSGFSSGMMGRALNADSTRRVFKGSNASTGTSTLTFPSACGTRSAPSSTDQFYVALLP